MDSRHGSRDFSRVAAFARKMGLQQLQQAVGRIVGADGKEIDCMGQVRHMVKLAVVKQATPLVA